MKTFTARSASICTVCSLLLGSGTAFAADVTLQKVPALTVEQAPAFPENLARRHLGARAEISSATGEQGAVEGALLSGDPTAAYPLPLGASTVLVSLAKIENIDSVSFQNSGAKGDVTIATASAKLSADSPQWQNVAEQSLSGPAVTAKIGPSEAKYVRLTFNVTEPGAIAGFGVYATPAVSDFTAPRRAGMDDDRSFGLISYNYTDIHAKARALYVTSGSNLKQANNMIDDQTTTSYSFAANDKAPTTVIDLGTARSLRRLSAVYAPRSGKMEFYVLPSLPNAAPAADGATTAPDQMTLNDASFASMKAVGVSDDDGSLGRAAVDFPETSGRYVMVRWLPAAAQEESFTLAEIAAIGGAPTTLLAANTTNPGGAVDEDEMERVARSSDGKTMLDGKTMIDAKDMPGEGLDEEPQAPGEGPPPSLPQAPPFTFVPVLVPTSP